MVVNDSNALIHFTWLRAGYFWGGPDSRSDKIEHNQGSDQLPSISWSPFIWRNWGPIYGWSFEIPKRCSPDCHAAPLPLQVRTQQLHGIWGLTQTERNNHSKRNTFKKRLQLEGQVSDRFPAKMLKSLKRQTSRTPRETHKCNCCLPLIFMESYIF